MSSLLSGLPNMNSLLEHTLFSGIGAERVKRAAREVLDELRDGIISGDVDKLPNIDECAEMVLNKINGDAKNLRGIINATGIILHTNLGRAPLGMEMFAAAAAVCTGYCNLEYDLETGCRGSRYSHVESLICELTGAEAAMVVNNNAAAVVLMLSALAAGKKVAISRGELVEIGGSFRIPEIIEQGGATLVEIGTTNKTRLSDYAYAVENKGAEALLKIHTSNFEIIGFTESVSIRELAMYGKSIGLPVLYDMGSCFLIEPERLGLQSGETARSAITAGADIICFSGDKLLGSVQSGIIAGRSEYIDKIKRHPLARAVRPDKLTLSVLEACLRLYRYPDEAVQRIPILAMLHANSTELYMRSVEFAKRLADFLDGWCVEICEIMDETGGGSLPNAQLPGWAVSLKPLGMSVNELERRLRCGRIPVIIRIQDDRALISLRTLMLSDEDRVIQALREAVEN